MKNKIIIKYIMTISKLSFNLSKFSMIMLFYILISYVVGPLIGYYALGKTSAAAGHGFVAGSIVSILLWYLVGSKMV
jgi:hypothetical protein